MLVRRGLVWCLSLILCGQGPAVAEDWPHWRGPGGDGVWHENGAVGAFSQPKLSARWRASISNGYSGPTVADGRVYVTDRVTDPNQAERVHCFSAANGRQVWSYTYPCVYEGVAHRNGPRAAVTLSDGRAYSLGTMGHLHCFDARTGTVLWARELKKEYRIRVPEWGIAPAPLVEGRFVIVLIGGDGACLVAFDKVIGAEVWRALDDRAGYSTPIVIDQAGRRVLVAWTGQRVTGLDPTSGRLLWSHPFEPAQMVHNIASPVFHEGYLFLSGFFDGSLLLKVHPSEFAVEEIWRRRGSNVTRTEALHCCISTPILAGEYIYGIDSYGQLRCLDLTTGNRIWENLDVVPQARWATAHLIPNGDKVWMFTERGELVISSFSPKGYQEISRAKLIEPTTGQLNQRGGVCWAPPAFAGRHVYVRSDEALVCADLSAGNVGPTDANALHPPVQEWFPVAPSLGVPQDEVVEVSTVKGLLSAIENAKPGQTILVADGHYFMPRYIEITADNITLRGASGHRERVILDGARSKHGELLGFRNCTGVTVADLAIQNVKWNSFKINSETGVQELTIHNCIIHNIWQRGVKGVKVPQDNREVLRPRRCRIQHCFFYNDRPKRLSDDESDIAQGNYIAGIDVMYAKEWVIRDNVFVGIQGRTGEGRGAIFLWFDAQDCIVERNAIIDCDVGLQLGNPHRADGVMYHCVRCVARNNFITRAPEAGIVTVHTKDCHVLHNTVHDPHSRLGRLIRTVFTNDGLLVANNLLSGPAFSHESPSAVRFLNNPVGDVSFVFVDSARGDLHLTRAGAAVVGGGVRLPEVMEDIDRQARGVRTSVGADEPGTSNGRLSRD